MSIKTMELQKASLEALRGTQASANPGEKRTKSLNARVPGIYGTYPERPA